MKSSVSMIPPCCRALPLFEECLDLAQQAPTASNRQHWGFLVVTDAAPWVFQARILWTCALGDGMYENGGSFLDVET